MADTNVSVGFSLCYSVRTHSPEHTGSTPMAFYESSLLLLEPVAESISRNRGAMLARGIARGALASRVAAPLAFLAPRAHPLGAALSLGLLAWEAWNAFGGEEQPFPATRVPYPPNFATTQWEIRAVYKLEPNGTLPVPPLTVDTGWVLAAEEILYIEIQTFGTSGASTLVARVRSSGVEQDLGLGGGGSGYKILQIQSLEVRSVTANAPLYPYPVQEGIPGTEGQYGDAPILIEIPNTPGGFPYPTQIPGLLRRPGQLGDRPVPVIYDPSIPEEQRRGLPQAWITPEGVQIGRGGRGDPIGITGDAIGALDDLLDLDSDYRSRVPPEVTTCTPETDPPGDCCDCAEIREIVIEELDLKFPPRRPNGEVEITFDAADSGSINLPEFSKSVTVTIVQPPANIKEQEGNASAPNIFYNGWYSFGVDTFGGDRKPIQYNSQSMPVPRDARTFTYTIIGSGTASVTVVYTEET